MTPEQREERARRCSAAGRKGAVARRAKAVPFDPMTVKLNYDSAAIAVDRDELRAAIAEAEKRAAARAAKKAAKKAAKAEQP